MDISKESPFSPAINQLRLHCPEVRSLDGYWLPTDASAASLTRITALDSHSIVETAKAVATFLYKFVSLTDVSIFAKGVTRHTDSLANFIGWIQRFHPDGNVPGISSTHENSLILQQSANAAIGVLDKQQVVALQTLEVQNLCLETDTVKIKANVRPTAATASLDPSIFAASTILCYYKQLMEQVDHVDMYKTVDALTAFGEQLNLLREEQGQSVDDIEQSWRDIALLTGWELIRRCKEDGLKERHLDNTRDIIDSGLRILRHRDVQTVQQFATVAFALGERE
ncbi:40S ribosomal protein S27A, ubiquitin fusion prot ein [Trichuris trichiura]|uniref:40S ribosomal protein S27A, ubiquitin fusion prot ein n=1 Tax=Trichuris trichiura TaxID=36087 RepID=A0A077Z6V9_TRITR|nr:40S ribosomal protein S27A, ubiquitin fusion prot ein [Trichuris trichiura]